MSFEIDNIKGSYGVLTLILGMFISNAALASTECRFEAPWLSESSANRILRALGEDRQEVVVSEDADNLLLQLFLWSKLIPIDAPLAASTGFSLDRVADRNESQLNGLIWLVAHSEHLSQELNLDAAAKSAILDQWIENEFVSNPHQIIGLSRFRQARFGVPGVSLKEMLDHVNGPVGQVFFHISAELEGRGKTEDAYAALRVAVEYSELRGLLGLFDFYIVDESCHERAQIVQWINRALWLNW